MTDPSDLFDVMHHQRATRSFRPDPVPDELLARVLDAATFAPSAENKQPWEFVVVRDPSVRSVIGDLTRRAWDAGGREHSLRRLSSAMFTAVEQGATGGISAAPILIVVAADTQRGLAVTVASSIFPATQNLLLAATAVGLGSALTTIATTFADELRDLIGAPAHVLPVAVVPIGFPERPLGPPRREPFAGHTHRDRYGSPW